MNRNREVDECRASESCHGAAVATFDRCLRHLSPEELPQALEVLGRRELLDARRVDIDAALVEQMLIAAPQDSSGRPVFAHVDFSDATFTERAAFPRAVFGADVLLTRCVFRDRANFRGAEFGDNVDFRAVLFEALADFTEARFGNHVRFGGAKFRGETRFAKAVFGESASFAENVSFGDDTTFTGAQFGRRARFDRGTFGTRATFRDASFASEASFRDAVLGDEASFERAQLGREASFSQSRFGALTRFADAVFDDQVSFRSASFGPGAQFRRVAFRGRVRFSEASFSDRVSFGDTQFSGPARFTQARFLGRSEFESAVFGGETYFEHCHFDGPASFRLTQFERSRKFGPLVSLSDVNLDQARFDRAIDIQVCARGLSAVQSSFLEGATLRLRWVAGNFDSARFGGPSIVTSSRPFSNVDEEALARTMGERDSRASVLSLRGADVGQLVVAGVDLRNCRFAGSHRLDRLRLEGASRFARTAGWRLARRKVVAEEVEWRARRTQRWRVERDEPPPAGTVSGSQILEPHEIAGIYRSLRKGSEDSRDAPGAGDFYFGEMEMRRLDPGTSLSERVLLNAYWLLSGYGLRASRSLVALVILMLASGYAFHRLGFCPRMSFDQALVHAAQSTSSLLRFPNAAAGTETTAGQLIEIVVRILGVLLIGLSLLSFRARVKR